MKLKNQLKTYLKKSKYVKRPQIKKFRKTGCFLDKKYLKLYIKKYKQFLKYTKPTEIKILQRIKCHICRPHIKRKQFTNRLLIKLKNNKKDIFKYFKN